MVWEVPVNSHWNQFLFIFKTKRTSRNSFANFLSLSTFSHLRRNQAQSRRDVSRGYHPHPSHRQPSSASPEHTNKFILQLPLSNQHYSWNQTIVSATSPCLIQLLTPLGSVLPASAAIFQTQALQHYFRHRATFRTRAAGSARLPPTRPALMVPSPFQTCQTCDGIPPPTQGSRHAHGFQHQTSISVKHGRIQTLHPCRPGCHRVTHG